jgi:ADP-heptose:LPS heptosyltransferase
MNIGIFLSYKGLGANLLHLAYCHEISRKFGPVTIITLNENLYQVVKDDPMIKEIVYLNNFHKKFFDVVKLSKFFKKFNFDSFFIFYPSIRFFLASKLANIKNIYTYPLFIKKKLHLVKAAKIFTEKHLKINSCPTETNIFISNEQKENAKKNMNMNKKNIIIGAGSSGATTKWGENNFINLINKLNLDGKYFFYILCGPNEKKISEKILSALPKNNCLSFANNNIKEIIPTMSLCDLYIGNDSFGHHVASQCGIPSIIIMLDTPSAYSDYSNNQYRILPDGVDINDIDHNSLIDPNEIKVEKVYQQALTLLN